MLLPQTSKTKSRRTWWGYHHHDQVIDWLDVARKWSGAILLLAVLGPVTVWGLALCTSRGQGSVFDRNTSPGEVTSAHAAWDHQCEVCHQPFQPMRSEKPLPLTNEVTMANLLMSFVPEKDMAYPSDLRCQRCHEMLQHHDNMLTSDLGQCADCHHDHQGRSVSLTDLDDSACIRCHADLPSHREQGRPSVLGETVIAGFTHGHPEFRAVAPVAPDAKSTELTSRHQRGLKFSHAVHMQLGMGLKRSNPLSGDVSAGGPFRYGQIRETDRARYLAGHSAGDNDPVQLECNNCHQLDAGRTTATVAASQGLPGEMMQPARGNGWAYLPIVYEKHCHGCHSLGFDTEVNGPEVPHRLQPPEVQSFLLSEFSQRLVTNRVKQLLQQPDLPARLDPPAELFSEEDRAQLLKQAQSLAEQAEEHLYALLAFSAPATKTALDDAAVQLFEGRTTCGECHYGEGTAREGFPAPATIRPVHSPSIWQPRAKFDHLSHEVLECKVCHPQSASTDLAKERAEAIANTDTKVWDDVYQHRPDLPSIELCKKCHSPVDRRQQTGGISHRCTDCHTYHGAQHGLQGRGARQITDPGHKHTDPSQMLFPQLPTLPTSTTE